MSFFWMRLRSSDSITPALAVGATTWFVIRSLYLFAFWSLSGQTPGMRFLDIRIEVDGDHHIGARHARRRLVGFWLATIPLMLGFIGVLTRRTAGAFTTASALPASSTSTRANRMFRMNFRSQAQPDSLFVVTMARASKEISCCICL